MKTKIGMRALGLLLVVALAGAVFVPAVSAESIDSKLSKDAEIQQAILPEATANIDCDAQYRESLTYIKEYLLKSDINPKEYSEIIKLIDEELMKKEIMYDDFLKIIKIVDPYLPNPDMRGTKWSSQLHKDIAHYAGDRMGLSTAQGWILYNYADDADLLIPPISSWDHYATTGAPDNVESYANDAINKINAGDEAGGYEKLAYALHFMTDMSMPFHINILNLIEHTDYEGYVHGNWEAGYNYKSTMTNFNYYYIINDLSDSAWYCSSSAGQYKDYLVDQGNNNPGWRDDPTLISYTRDCMEWASGYNKGVVKYVQDRT